VKGERVWFEVVRVARWAQESFPLGERVMGMCSSSRKEVLRTDEGERERRSTAEGREKGRDWLSSGSSAGGCGRPGVRAGEGTEEGGEE
jgi:hypothetical protein